MREGDEGRKDPTRSQGGVSGVCVGGSLGHPEAVLCPLWELCDADAAKTHRDHRNEKEELRFSFL